MIDLDALLLKTLGDPTRLRLVVLLARGGEMCVCHLSSAIGGPQYRVSRHLAILRAAGIVEARREGTWMHYRLAVREDGIGRALIELLAQRLGEDPDLLCRQSADEKECCRGLENMRRRTAAGSTPTNGRERKR